MHRPSHVDENTGRRNIYKNEHDVSEAYTYPTWHIDVQKEHPCFVGRGDLPEP